ncbi:MAG: hypothetical protein VW258_00350 [Thalassolituus sp.]
MSLTIGFICLGAFALIMLIHRLTAEWRGTHAEHGGIEYEYRVYDGSAGRQIKVGMNVSRRYDFVLRRHGGVDKALAKAGIESDKRICNQAFDDSLVILSDDFTASQALAAAPGLSDKLLNLFSQGSVDTVQVRKLVCRRGRLWALVEDKARDPEQMIRFRETALPAMAEFADAMQRLEGPFPEQRPDRYAVPAVALLLLTTAFMTKSVLQWFDAGTPLPEGGLVMKSVVVGGLIAVALAALALRTFRYNLTNHRIFAELLFVGMLGTSATIYADRAIEQSSAVKLVQLDQSSYSDSVKQRGG